MNIIFEVYGGIGKNIIATAIVEILRKTYPNDNLVVIATHPEIFYNNPNINYLGGMDDKTELIENFVADNQHNCKFFVKNVYQESEYIKGETSIYKVWAEMFGLRYRGEKPKIYLSKEEKKLAKVKSKKPILVIHPNGGGVVPKDHPSSQPYNWARDLPKKLTQDIINEYKDEYEVHYIKHESQPQYYFNAEPATQGIREILILLLRSDKRIFIDSFAQHMARALNLPSTVCWIATKSKVFGYDYHKNVQANDFEYPTTMHEYQGYAFAEPLLNMPYSSTDKIFDIKQIIK